MKQTYIKQWTRDNSLIVQEIWYKNILYDVYNNKTPYYPPIIFYFKDGVVEIWDNTKSIQWFKDKLLKRNKEEPEFYDKSMQKYKPILEKLKKAWTKKELDSIKELQNFIELAEKGTKYFLVFYYSASDSRTPKEIREKALKIRDKDAFYDNTNKVINSTLLKLKPEFKEVINLISSEELNNIPKIDELKKRWSEFVFIPNKIAKHISLEEFNKKNSDYDFHFDKINNKGFVKGQGIGCAIIRGRVRIIKRKSQIKDVKQGDIIVSPMTTPDFVPAMKKAAGIVTDEGGIICHAAIISKELKKPCVIGTKVATQLFQDNDLIEVNTNTGVVRLITNNKY